MLIESDWWMDDSEFFSEELTDGFEKSLLYLISLGAELKIAPECIEQ